MALAFKNSENNGLAGCSSSSKAFKPSRAEVALIKFNLAKDRGLLFAKLCYSLANRHEIPVHGVTVEPGDLGDLRGIQVDGKELHELPKLGLRGFRTACVPVNHCQDLILAG